MTLCPVALVVGCKRCPVFAVCPAKTLIGDYRPEEKKSSKAEPKSTGKPRR